MDDLDLLLKKEIPVQNRPDDTLQVVIPVNPKILGLPLDVRMDESIAREVLDSLAEEYDEDVAHYLAGAELSDEFSQQLRSEGYAKFRDGWKFSFREGNGFLDLEWGVGDQPILMGYVGCPVVVENLFTVGTGKLATYGDMIPSTGDMGIILWHVQKGKPDLVLFHKEKLLRFRHPNVEFYAEDLAHAETAVPAFASSYALNVPQTMLLRNFGVKYMNALLGRVEGE